MIPNERFKNGMKFVDVLEIQYDVINFVLCAYKENNNRKHSHAQSQITSGQKQGP